MKLQVTLTDGTEFGIDLVEHEFVHEWARRVVQFPIKKTHRTRITGYGSGSDERDSNMYQQRCAELIAGLTRLRDDYAVAVPVQYFSPPDADADSAAKQNYCNTVHRWVVFTQKNWPHPDGNQSAIELIHNNKDHNIPGGLFNTLNGAVHTLEGTYRKPRESLLDPALVTEQWYWDTEFVHENWRDRYYVRKEWADFRPGIESLLTNRHHTVWFAKRILGKDFREVWIDDDDPTQPEVVNFDDHLQYAFEIDLNNRQQFYNGSAFRKWLTDWDIKYQKSRMGRVPIGNVDCNQTQLQEKINDLTIQIAKLHIDDA